MCVQSCERALGMYFAFLVARPSVIKIMPQTPILAVVLPLYSAIVLVKPSAETFDLLEDLMLLEGGRLAYFGTTERARHYFDSLAGDCPANVNPAGAYALHWKRRMPRKANELSDNAMQESDC